MKEIWNIVLVICTITVGSAGLTKWMHDWNVPSNRIK
jgi:hypothetical protein